MSKLEDQLASHLQNRCKKSQLRALTTIPASNIDFSSNAYLSLSSIPSLLSDYHTLLQNHASLGSGGSRLLDGNSTFAETLEREIAAFHNAPAGLLFNSGFDANVGLVSTLPQRGDVVVYDELVHASAHDGMRLSRAGRKISFKHNCVQALDDVLASIGENVSVFVLVEGVYSMDGDVAPLRDIVACVKTRLNGNGYVIVDEAHSTGVYGKQGRGLVCELGLEDEVFARLHTFGKAMSSFGAIVICSSITREYLINYARTLIYTTALPLSCLASISMSYRYLQNGLIDERLTHLWSLVRHTHKLLKSLSSTTVTISVNKEPRSPIIPVFTSEPRSLARFCQERGFTVRPIVAPTVPKGSERVRVCLYVGNTIEEVEGLIRVTKAWVKAQEGETARL
ncbi:pyridoxal phosphate-dependent transferase [Fusarium flagelliforme]|uniref:pyridoxal phosphate-dependent transferase n=1 Tax=Fusarium flagelliforme TaxID=2675880 RepID=UPI001E8E06D4|nr:pyridoxal phosphate-dependent transferase [Fusarium flagelliforme]KAH7179088.1 pyridoxal phosphate-dependent transferase [Fusarium flagelliforme]